MRKNTLYITFDGLSDPLGQSQILPYLSGIAANNIAITILSCEKKERLEKEKETIRTLIAGLPITWEYILYDADAGTLSRLLYILRIKNLAEKSCKEKKISLVHCRSYLAALIGLSLKRKWGIPFIFDMRGFWADERIEGGIWRKNNPLHRFFYMYFKKKERQFILKSDSIVSLTKAGIAELTKQYPDKKLREKTTVIPCCTNTDFFHAKNITGLEKKISVSSNNHLIIYTGSVGTWYYTREMIDCILSWRQFIPEIRLLVLTKDTDELQKILTTYSAEEQSYVSVGSVAYKEVPAYLALAKAAIFFIKPCYSKTASSPTKMAECWAMDLPIITNSGIGDNDFYFKQHKGGLLLNDFTQTDYIEAGRRYLTLSEHTGTYRKIALDHFDTKMAVEKYTNIYRSLIL